MENVYTSETLVCLVSLSRQSVSSKELAFEWLSLDESGVIAKINSLSSKESGFECRKFGREGVQRSGYGVSSKESWLECGILGRGGLGEGDL